MIACDRPQVYECTCIKDCTQRQEDEAGVTADWIGNNWSAFESRLESIRGWSINIKNCLRNRFQKNGKIDCETSNLGSCAIRPNGLWPSAWASRFNRKCHFFPIRFDTLAEVSGKENRQACYAAQLTHEWAHTCDRGHVVTEIIDNEAFDFWRDNHSGVTVSLESCGLD